MDLIVIIKNVVLFIIFYFLFKSIMRKINEAGQETQERSQAAVDKTILESLVVEIEEAEYKDQIVLLGYGVYAEGRLRRFVSQGMTMQELLENAFKRFPNKNIIHWFKKGDSSKHKNGITVNETNFNTATREQFSTNQ